MTKKDARPPIFLSPPYRWIFVPYCTGCEQWIFGCASPGSPKWAEDDWKNTHWAACPRTFAAKPKIDRTVAYKLGSPVEQRAHRS
jgi:hypothetical protein